MNIEVNYLAIVLAMVASMVIGFLWYSPLILGKPWMKLMGYKAEDMKENQKKMGPWYLFSAILALLTAFVLSHVMTLSEAYFHYPILSTGLITAFWMWIGFVLPVQATDMIFGKDKKTTLLTINTGYQLVSLIAMAIVIALVS